MTITKHTPGPWLLSAGWQPTPSVVDHQNVYAGSRIGVVAKVVMAGQDGDYSAERAANAHLIVAAPDLLDALRDAERHLEEMRKDPKWHPIGDCPVLRKVRRAIAKAEAHIEETADMTADELKAFLEENKADIQAAIKAKMIESLLANHRWEISAEISKVVEAFVAAEIVPEVKKCLADQKGAILQAFLVGAADIGNTIAKGMAEHAAKNLTTESYRFRQVMEALFK